MSIVSKSNYQGGFSWGDRGALEWQRSDAGLGVTKSRNSLPTLGYSTHDNLQLVLHLMPHYDNSL